MWRTHSNLTRSSIRRARRGLGLRGPFTKRAADLEPRPFPFVWSVERTAEMRTVAFEKGNGERDTHALTRTDGACGYTDKKETSRSANVSELVSYARVWDRAS